MATQTEEQQAADFLKRAEIRTMRKDLSALRESDSLKERDKIARLKTLEEQLAASAKATAAEAEKQDMANLERIKRDEVLQKNEGQERLAEKDLKNYATEQERQQIFLLESQRFELEKQAESIDKEKAPTLKLEENKLLLQRREQQAKLDAVLEEEKKLEGEEKMIQEKEQSSTMAQEKKGLEQARWDLDKKIQEIEKKRWAAEKLVQETDEKIKQTGVQAEQLVAEKNSLRDKILGADKQLRDLYSVVMEREEERRRGKAAEQVAGRAAAEKARAEEREAVQRQQWQGVSQKKREESILTKVPLPPVPKRK